MTFSKTTFDPAAYWATHQDQLSLMSGWTELGRERGRMDLLGMAKWLTDKPRPNTPACIPAMGALLQLMPHSGPARDALATWSQYPGAQRPSIISLMLEHEIDIFHINRRQFKNWLDDSGWVKPILKRARKHQLSDNQVQSILTSALVAVIQLPHQPLERIKTVQNVMTTLSASWTDQARQDWVSSVVQDERFYPLLICLADEKMTRAGSDDIAQMLGAVWPSFWDRVAERFMTENPLAALPKKAGGREFTLWLCQTSLTLEAHLTDEYVHELVAHGVMRGISNVHGPETKMGQAFVRLCARAQNWALTQEVGPSEAGPGKTKRM